MEYKLITIAISRNAISINLSVNRFNFYKRLDVTGINLK